MKKIRIGFDINDVIRAFIVSFKKHYIKEFGEEGIIGDKSLFIDNYIFNEEENISKYLYSDILF